MRRPITWLALMLALSLIMSLAPRGATAGVVQADSGPNVADVRIGTPDVSETFRRDKGAWMVGISDVSVSAIEDGMLTIIVTEAETLAWSLYDGVFGDFYVEVDTAHLDGTLDNEFGVMFRIQDGGDFYLFTISSDGYYRLRKYADGDQEAIIQWTESEFIESGFDSENRIGLLAAGDWIVLLVNDVELERISDDSFTSGQIALAVGSLAEPGPMIGFDNFRLWEASPQGGSGSAPSDNATVSSDSLTVRSGPSTSYPVVAQLRRGERAQMVGRTANSQWVQLQLSGIAQAWVQARHLRPDVGVQSLPVAQTPRPPASPATPTTPAPRATPTLPPAPVAASPEECLAGWLQVADGMVANGYATYGDFLSGNSGQNTEPSITSEGCNALQQQTAQLGNYSCSLDDSTNLARSLSDASTSAYRRCQRLFPDNWDSMCLSQFATDQRLSKQTIAMLTVQTWRDLCR